EGRGEGMGGGSNGHCRGCRQRDADAETGCDGDVVDAVAVQISGDKGLAIDNAGHNREGLKRPVAVARVDVHVSGEGNGGDVLKSIMVEVTGDDAIDKIP